MTCTVCSILQPDPEPGDGDLHALVLLCPGPDLEPGLLQRPERIEVEPGGADDAVVPGRDSQKRDNSLLSSQTS